jgi:hypothetical protein
MGELAPMEKNALETGRHSHGIQPRPRAVPQSRYRGREARHAKNTGERETVASVERLAKADRRLAATIGQWDHNPELLNMP